MTAITCTVLVGGWHDDGTPTPCGEPAVGWFPSADTGWPMCRRHYELFNEPEVPVQWAHDNGSTQEDDR